MTQDGKNIKKRVANWLGSPRRVIHQLLVSGFSFISLPTAKFYENATHEFFTKLYNGKLDPLVFDGKNQRYFEQIELIYDIRNLNNRTVLDLGCGSGSLFYWLSMRKINLKNYIGFDFAHPEKELDQNACIIRKGIDSIDIEEFASPTIVAVNILCYLNMNTINSILRHQKQGAEFIIIDPIPGLFWDAHFAGVKPFYRKPSRIIEMLELAGWKITGMSIDYGTILKNHFVFPLSYCITANSNRV